MRDLLLVVPSRGRPGNIERLWNALDTTCHADTAMVVGVDDDDTSGYSRGRAYVRRSGLHQVTAWINELAVPRTKEFRAIGHIGDDNVPLTPGWDRRVLDALEETPFAFGNDLYPREPGSLPCHIFMRSEVIDALGYMAPPGFRHMADLAWLEWGRACGITFLADVIIEHLHWSVGKAGIDEVYQQVNACDAPDNEYYHVYRAGQLAVDVAAINAAKDRA